MNIAIDIDETLNDNSHIRIKRIQKYLKSNKLHFNLINKTTNQFTEMFDWTEKDTIQFFKISGDNMLANSKMMKGARQAVEKLKKMGHKIFIVTARDYKWHTDAYALSKNWLDKKHIPYDVLEVDCAPSKVPCYKKHNIDLVIDDSVSVYEDCIKNNIPVILFEGIHNKDFAKTAIQTAKDWKQAVKMVSKI